MLGASRIHLMLHQHVMPKAVSVVSLAIIFAIVLAMVNIAPAQAKGMWSVPDEIAITSTAPAEAILTQDEAAIVARTGKWIEVSLSRQRLYAWQNGRLVMSSLISSGLSRTPTLRGSFRIYVKYRATRMRGPGYNLPNVPYTMYYSGSYAIHGAYWHNNFGHPMSHGCINLPVPFSRQLYYWAPVGTLVVVHS